MNKMIVMKVGDLVKPSGSFAYRDQVGIIIEGPIDRIMLWGPSLQKQVLVWWEDGTQQWYHTDNLEIIQ